MSDTANHKKAIDVLRVARKTPGLLLDVLLQVISDDPAKIVNAYEKVKPGGDWLRKTVDLGPRCRGCNEVFSGVLIHGRCPKCLPRC